MRTFTSQFSITALKRQVYTGNKSALTTQSGTPISCYLHPTALPDAEVAVGQWARAYDLIVEADGVLPAKGDRLTIVRSKDLFAMGDFLVQGVADHTRGGATAYLKFSLQRVDEKTS